jgi:hypothetical protein
MRRWFHCRMMSGSMALVTQRDQILFGILARVTAELLVVDFKVGHRTAGLTTPTIPPQYSLP